MAIYITVSYRSFSSGYDIDQTVTTMLYWSMIEACLGSMTSSLPVLSPLFRKIRFSDSLNRLLDNLKGMSSTRPNRSWFGYKVQNQAKNNNVTGGVDLEMNWIRFPAEEESAPKYRQNGMNSSTQLISPA
jgi:hypothetical protein